MAVSFATQASEARNGQEDVGTSIARADSGIERELIGGIRDIETGLPFDRSR